MPPRWPAASPNAASDRGDVVALLSYNCPEFLEAIFAANYLGAIAMPINWRLAAPEVRYILEHSGARALVCDESLRAAGQRSDDAASSRLTRVRLSMSAGRAADGQPSPTFAPAPATRPRASRPRPTTSTG